MSNIFTFTTIRAAVHFANSDAGGAYIRAAYIGYVDDEYGEARYCYATPEAAALAALRGHAFSVDYSDAWSIMSFRNKFGDYFYSAAVEHCNGYTHVNRAEFEAFAEGDDALACEYTDPCDFHTPNYDAIARKQAEALNPRTITRVTTLTESRATGSRNWLRRVVLFSFSDGETIAKDYTGGGWIDTPQVAGAESVSYRVPGGELSKALKGALYVAFPCLYDTPAALSLWGVSVDGGRTFLRLASTYEDARNAVKVLAGCSRLKGETHSGQDGAKVISAKGETLATVHLVDPLALVYDRDTGTYTR